MELTQRQKDRAWHLAQRWAPVYAALKWQWHVGADIVGPRCVPNAAQLYELIIRLAEEKSAGAGCVSSGGLTVIVTDDDEIIFRFEDEQEFDAHA